ncbi:amino acid adenylation domain-containing protein [Duganella sp. CF458]|uniref:non-ribosomal peptide synthetase n=1 Tax=Duganella sp. CF458 TaxID=1884368 RepID=UPI0008EAE1DE|nr:non-ribosomal peptide synthetase [Duganella sp. CF458]SFG37631.1 amino acid adenylation domain-containing protein [Duganella sp. CF458]
MDLSRTPAGAATVIDDSLSLHAMLLRQVAARPQALAVQCGSERLSYAALHRQQQALAALLQRHRLGAGAVVGIYLERGNALLAAILAVNSVGAAFLLLDPATPTERLARMVEQSGLRYVLTQAAMPGLPGAPAATRIHLDDGDGAAPPLPRPASAQAPCYLMFTSGSSGLPKGVQLGCGGLSHLLQAMAGALALQADDNVLVLSSLGFDIALLELLMPLVCGACATIVPQAALGDSAAIRSLIDTAAVSVVQATPSSFQWLAAGSWRPRRRLQLLCGGEVLPPGLLKHLLQLGERVWHAYGPTETTIWSLLQPISDPATPVLLGAPIGRTQLRVLDAALRPVAPGDTGELYLGGPGLALGYLSGERQRFVTLEGGVFYRTGDRVRRGSQGLEFVGRSDRQVKIRGHRLELDEVEALLRSHPLVAAAAVTAEWSAGHCSATLAYLVLHGLDGGLPDALTALAIDELKRWLGQRLPRAALPRHYRVLASLPLTASGKTAYAALPAAAAPCAAAPAPPPGALERRLLALWQRLLKLEQLGLEDDFFAIGGDSLLAAMLAFEVQQAFGIEFSIATVLENSSLRGMAAAIARAAGQRDE